MSLASLICSSSVHRAHAERRTLRCRAERSTTSHAGPWTGTLGRPTQVAGPAERAARNAVGNLPPDARSATANAGLIDRSATCLTDQSVDVSAEPVTSVTRPTVEGGAHAVRRLPHAAGRRAPATGPARSPVNRAAAPPSPGSAAASPPHPRSSRVPGDARATGAADRRRPVPVDERRAQSLHAAQPLVRTELPPRRRPRVVVASRPIAAGETLTIDYATRHRISDKRVRVQLRHRSCRGKVTGHDWMLPELQLATAAYFSPYLASASPTSCRTGAERRAFALYADARPRCRASGSRLLVRAHAGRWSSARAASEPPSPRSPPGARSSSTSCSPTSTAPAPHGPPPRPRSERVTATRVDASDRARHRRAGPHGAGRHHRQRVRPAAQPADLRRRVRGRLPLPRHGDAHVVAAPDRPVPPDRGHARRRAVRGQRRSGSSGASSRSSAMGVEPGLSDVVARYAADHLFSRDRRDRRARRQRPRHRRVRLRPDVLDLDDDRGVPQPADRVRARPGLVHRPSRSASRRRSCSPRASARSSCVNVEHEEVILMPRWLDVGRVTFKYGLGDEFIDVLRDAAHARPRQHPAGDGPRRRGVARATSSPRCCRTRPSSATGCAGRTCAGSLVRGLGLDGRPREVVPVPGRRQRVDDARVRPSGRRVADGGAPGGRLRADRRRRWKGAGVLGPGGVRRRALPGAARRVRRALGDCRNAEAGPAPSGSGTAERDRDSPVVVSCGEVRQRPLEQIDRLTSPPPATAVGRTRAPRLSHRRTIRSPLPSSARLTASTTTPGGRRAIDRSTSRAAARQRVPAIRRAASSIPALSGSTPSCSQYDQAMCCGAPVGPGIRVARRP